MCSSEERSISLITYSIMFLDHSIAGGFHALGGSELAG